MKRRWFAEQFDQRMRDEAKEREDKTRLKKVKEKKERQPNK